MRDVRRERIPLLWSTVRKTALAKSFFPGKGCVHSETVREVDRK